MKNLYKYTINFETGEANKRVKEDVTIVGKKTIVSIKNRSHELNYCSNNYVEELNKYREITKNTDNTYRNYKTIGISYISLKDDLDIKEVVKIYSKWKKNELNILKEKMKEINTNHSKITESLLKLTEKENTDD